jgi:hypothetical protein
VRVVAFAPNLMDSSKLRNAGAVMVRVAADLAAIEADVVVVDISRPGVLEVVADIECRVIGFGRHTEVELLAAAEAAGCAEVVVRSVFFKRLADHSAWCADRRLRSDVPARSHLARLEEQAVIGAAKRGFLVDVDATALDGIPRSQRAARVVTAFGADGHGPIVACAPVVFEPMGFRAHAILSSDRSTGPASGC